MTARLRLRGELSSGAADLTGGGDGWTSSDGVTVTINGPEVSVEWSNPVAPTDGSFDRMMEEVEATLLLECLRTGNIPEVRWIEREVAGASATTHQGSFTASSYIVRAQRGLLSAHAGRVDRVAAAPSVLLALRRYRDAMKLLMVDPRAAVALAYVAVEGIVDELSGNTRGSDWLAAEAPLGLSPGTLGTLYDSAQLTRHHDASGAKDRLAIAGVSPLTPNEICGRAATAIAAFLKIRSI